jgi:hypothetical protein
MIGVDPREVHATGDIPILGGLLGSVPLGGGHRNERSGRRGHFASPAG